MKEEEKQGLFRKGEEALAMAEFETALEYFGELVVEDPLNGEAWFHLGECYLETARPDLALEALQRARNADPSNATTYYMMGNAHGALGNLDQAADYYRQALVVEPSHTKAGEFLIKTEGLLESRKHYREALRLIHGQERPEDWTSRALAELVRSVAIFPESPARHHLQDSVGQVLKFSREEPISLELGKEDRPWVRLCDEGYQCLRRGAWEEAAQVYREALNFRYEDAFVHHGLALALFQLGKVDEAVGEWLRVLEIDPAYDLRGLGRLIHLS
ncbi:MAG: tetratricopeptide repeat protein [Acidobacteria bacterium]|nr:tetratricopeptide repeat protein [Acidobacteriota bacterium]